LIFVCVGSREYQFNRLLRKIDELIQNGEITECVFAQIGKSSYIPQNYKYSRFMAVDEFKSYQKKSDLIVSHGGTGALIGALKMGKQVLAVPRLEKYGEHTDDHQTQVAGVLEKEGYLRCILEMDDLLEGIKAYKKNPVLKIYNESSQVIGIIEGFINSDADCKKRCE